MKANPITPTGRVYTISSAEEAEAASLLGLRCIIEDQLDLIHT